MGWEVMAITKNKCQNMSRLSLVQDHNREEKKARLTPCYEATEGRTTDSKHDDT